jgi:phosphatidylethanolamine/phosphatidyl-N-methylethanolamine N-methyltransferase
MPKTKAHKSSFLKTYFKERKQVGALAPSSRFLVKKMCNKIDFATAINIIELGPGTGVFTKEILKRARKDAKIFVFELNDDFYKLLQSKFDDDRIVLLNKSAELMTDVLKEHNLVEVDAILSSLPLAVIPAEVKHKIIVDSYTILKKGGIYVQYQYSLNAKKLISKRFTNLKMSFSSINIPPAFIYCGVK